MVIVVNVKIGGKKQKLLAGLTGSMVHVAPVVIASQSASVVQCIAKTGSMFPRKIIKASEKKSSKAVFFIVTSLSFLQLYL